MGDGKETAKRQGFILPNEGKYVFCLGQEFKFLPNEVEFRIENVKWTRIDYKNFPNWQHFSQERLNIKADGAQFSSAKSTVLTEKLDLNELKFAIHNRTIFNYWNVNLKILLFSRGQIVSVNEYAVKNLMADESRHVAMTWPGRFSLVDKIEIMPEINITKKDIYINYEGGIGSLK
ncbi:MAG: hypothetical protein BWY51_00412 [Parcubacteria group bacterium ADurb.Bin316]|nr:MAG: hypothetical protein BWY51_00412 [Parcubacteria group bacterium ADurb.Bin316]